MLTNFVAHVVYVYPAKAEEFVALLVELLEDHVGTMVPTLRMVVVKSLILCRNKGLVAPVVTLSLAFKLFRIPDKPLRSLLFSHIVTDIKNINKKRRDNKLNSTLQNMLFGFLKDANKKAAKCALDVLVALFRKKVWTDAKTVNVIASACLVQDNTKMMVAALKFFVSDHSLDLGSAGEDDNDEDSRHISLPFKNKDDAKSHFEHTSKTKGRKRKLERALKRLEKNSRTMARREEKKWEANFAAIDLLYDGQTFAEKLFAILRSSRERFEVRLLMMDMIARCIATHELFVLNFYPYIQRYMQPHNDHAILILSIAAQSVHPLVPSDDITPLIQTLLYHFVNDRSSADVITVGLNTAREILRRNPDAIDEDILGDLVEYRTSKFKGVAMASRSILQLYRNIRPEMLHKRVRGREVTMAITAKKRKAREDANLAENSDEESGDGEAESESGELVTDDDEEGSESGSWVDVESEGEGGGEITTVASFGEVLDRSALDQFRRRPKMNAQERLEWVRAGRPEGHNYQHFRERKESSKTNLEKAKTKNFMMIRNSAKVRKKTSDLSIIQKSRAVRKHHRALKRKKKR